MHAPRRPIAMLLLFTLFAAVTIRAGAQNQLAGDVDLTNAFRKANLTFPKLRNGELEPKAADKEAMDAVARYLVYRFASTTAKTWDDMARLRREFVEYQIAPALTPEALKKNGAFRQQFGASLASAFRKLFESDFQEYRFQIINAAPTLIDAAKMRSDAFGDFLAELITDQDAVKGSKLTNMHDVIKLYALRGLREYYAEVTRSETTKVHQPRPIVPVLVGDEPLGDVTQKTMERNLRYINAVLRFAENRPGAGKRPLEEQDALRVLRREAIETLAATQAPLVAYGKKKVDAPIAALLLRVLSPKSDLEPPPSLAEKVEAAIGVCRMKYKNVDNYQAQLGMYLVGLFLVEFMTEANKDVGPISTGKLPMLPWRADAKRLELALKGMAANAKGRSADGKGPSVEESAKILEKAVPVLRNYQGKTLQAVNQGELNTFQKMVMSMKPKSNQVFKDIPEYTIDLGE